MTVFFVDGPDGVGKTGYSRWIAHENGIPRLEMRPIEDTEAIEAKSTVFNAAIRDLHDQGVDLVVDRGSVSSIVYSRVFDRGEPEHAWKTLRHVEPTIIYLRCGRKELGIRYGNNDELFSADEIRELADMYEVVMDEVDDETGADVRRVDTSSGAVENIEDAVFDVLHNEGSA